MDNHALQQIKDIIDQNDRVSIAVGPHPRIDEVAAALSLYLTFQTSGKNVSIASVTQPLVEHSSLVGVDKIQTTLQGTGGDLVVSFPYRDEGEIEKVSYTLDRGFLNIIVKPGENGFSFTERDVRFSHGGGLGGIFFAVGTPRMTDFGTLLPDDAAQTLTVINIDNKDQNENYGNVVLVSPRFSSVSEQVADLLLSLGYDFDLDTAQNLMVGISAATNNFQSPHTSYLAFEIAAILMRKGAQRPNRQHSQQQLQTQRQHDQRPREGKQTQQLPQHQQKQRQQVQPQSVQQNVSQKQQSEELNPPADWLTPKVYKGSTNI